MTYFKEIDPQNLFYLLLVALVPFPVFSLVWLIIFFGRREQLDRLEKGHPNDPTTITGSRLVLFVVVNALLYSIFSIFVGVFIVGTVSGTLYPATGYLLRVAEQIGRSRMRARSALVDRLAKAAEEIEPTADAADPELRVLSGRVNSRFFHGVNVVWEAMRVESNKAWKPLSMIRKNLTEAADATISLTDRMTFGNFIFQKACASERSLRDKVCSRSPDKAVENGIRCGRALRLIAGNESLDPSLLGLGKMKLAYHVFLNTSDHVRKAKTAFVHVINSTRHFPSTRFEFDLSVLTALERHMRNWSSESARNKKEELKPIGESVGFSIVLTWKNVIRKYYARILPTLFASSGLTSLPAILMLCGIVLLAFRTRCFRNRYFISDTGNRLLVFGTSLSSALLLPLWLAPIASIVITISSTDMCLSSGVGVYRAANGGDSYATGTTALKRCRNLQDIMVATGDSCALHLNTSELMSVELDPDGLEKSISDTLKDFSRADPEEVKLAVDEAAKIGEDLVSVRAAFSQSIINDFVEMRRLIDQHMGFLRRVFGKGGTIGGFDSDFEELMEFLDAYERVVDKVHSDVENLLLDLESDKKLADEAKRAIEQTIVRSGGWNDLVGISRSMLLQCINQSVVERLENYAAAVDRPLREARQSGETCNWSYGEIGRIVNSTCRAFSKTVLTGCNGQIVSTLFLSLATVLAYKAIAGHHRRASWKWGSLPALEQNSVSDQT